MPPDWHGLVMLNILEVAANIGACLFTRGIYNEHLLKYLNLKMDSRLPLLKPEFVTGLDQNELLWPISFNYRTSPYMEVTTT